MPALPHDKGIMAPPLTILRHRRRTIRQQRFVKRRPLFFQKFRPHGLPERLVFKQIHHRQAHCFARIYHPLVPDGHPAAGDHRPTVPGGFLGCGRNDELYLRVFQLTSATSVEPPSGNKINGWKNQFCTTIFSKKLSRPFNTCKV